MRVIPKVKNQDAVSRSREFAENKDESSFSPRFWYIIAISSIVLISLIFTISLSTLGLTSSIVLLLVLLGIPAALIIIGFPKIGIMALLVFAYFVMWILRMGVNFPLGTVVDGFYVLLLSGFFLKQKFNPNWESFKTPIGIIVLIWIVYNLLQFANPTAESRMAWVYTVRPVAGAAFMYFVFSYHIKTLSFLRFIFNSWILMAFIGALNAFKQQHFGFFAFEESTFGDPLVQALLFINGEWRKFSIFSDPVAFSYNMVIATIFCIARVISPNTLKKKIIYTALGVFFTMTMLYSATRAAYVLLPAAMILYVVMNLNRTVLALAIVGGFFFLVLINIPTGNVTLYRFQSAFKPNEDASFNVRKQNKKMIKPFIRSHPFGGGLGSTGANGVRFAPHSFLAKLPPDSTYVRVAVELGWVGILLLCTLFFLALKQGIRNYYRIRDPELKSYCLAMTLIIFALNVGSYPQESIVQYPINIYLFLFIALINITLKLDEEKQALKSLSK